MRYIDADGKEQRLEGVGAYLEAVQSNRLTADTMVFDETASKWVRADATAEYRSLKAGHAVDGVAEEAKKARLFQILGWLSLLAAFLLPVAAGSLIGTSTARVGERFGESLVFAGVAAIFVAIIFRKSRLFVKHGVFLAVMVTFLAYNLYGVFTDFEAKQAEDRARLALKDAVKRIDRMESSSTAPVLPPAELTKRDPDNSTEAFIARLPEFRQRGRALSSNFQNAMNALQLEDTLAPERAVTAAGIAASRTSIAKYEQLLNEYEKAYLSLQAAMRAEAGAVRGPGSEGFLQRFDDGSRPRLKVQSEWVQVERNLIAEMRRILDICQKHLGKTTVGANGMILFQDTTDVDAFNGALTKLQQYAKQESELQARSQKMEADSMEKFRELATKR